MSMHSLTIYTEVADSQPEKAHVRLANELNRETDY